MRGAHGYLLTPWFLMAHLVKIRWDLLGQIRGHAGRNPKCAPITGRGGERKQNMLPDRFMRQFERGNRLKYNRLDRSGF
jgi:hypothetical protein